MRCSIRAQSDSDSTLVLNIISFTWVPFSAESEIEDLARLMCDTNINDLMCHFLRVE